MNGGTVLCFVSLTPLNLRVDKCSPSLSLSLCGSNGPVISQTSAGSRAEYIPLYMVNQSARLVVNMKISYLQHTHLPLMNGDRTLFGHNNSYTQIPFAPAEGLEAAQRSSGCVGFSSCRGEFRKTFGSRGSGGGIRG